MFFDKSDRLYGLSIGFSDGDTLYENCVVYPRNYEIVRGEFTLEPFESLYSRFIAFDLQAKQEIDIRAKDTWELIVGFVKSLEAESIKKNSPYEIYIREVNHFKTLIDAVDKDQESVDYPSVLSSLFKRLEQYEDARREETESV